MKINDYNKWFKENYQVKPEKEDYNWVVVFNGKFYQAPTEVELIRNISINEDVLTYSQYKQTTETL